MKNVKLHKGQKGFTLVEVIVVAIIVAALAAVAVPLYLNYVKTSRTNSAANAAGSVASFCGACKNSTGALSDDASTNGGGTLTCNRGKNDSTTINIPSDIKIDVDSTGGSVKATHASDSSAHATYHY